MRKNPHDRIFKDEPKEQHLNTVSKSCSLRYYTCRVFLCWAFEQNY